MARSTRAIPRGTSVDEIAQQGDDFVIYKTRGVLRFSAVRTFGDTKILVESDPARSFTKAEIDDMKRSASTMMQARG